MRLVLTLSLTATLALTACSTSRELTWTWGADGKPTGAPGGLQMNTASTSPSPMQSAAAASAQTAVATLSPAAAGGAKGLVTFAAGSGGVEVRVVATGLTPGAAHGIHVHEHGNCASADFASAGGHFNPAGQPHGPQDSAHHAGDMPNLIANSQGNVDARFMVANATLVGPTGFVGHALVVHASPDDYKTQPSGNSGARLACGVIAAQ